MNEPTPTDTPTDTPAPIIRHISIHICQQCLDGKGIECHTPGCALCFHRVDIPIMRELYEILPEPPAPSLTGEEVSDEARSAADYYRTHAEHTGPLLLERVMQALLSTARAQDKAAMAKLQGELAAMKKACDFTNDCRKEWADRTIALKEEVARLKAEVEEANTKRKEMAKDFETAFRVVRLENDDLHTRLANANVLLESEKSLRMKVELAHETDTGELSARLLQAEKERNEVKEYKETERARHHSEIDTIHEKLALYETLGASLAITDRARDLAEQRVRELEKPAQRFIKMMEGIRDDEPVLEKLENLLSKMEAAESATLEAIRTASSCPTGTDLVDWVGQLAEDKRSCISFLKEASDGGYDLAHGKITSFLKARE